MKRNVGRVDRWFRVMAGIAILSLLFWLPGNQRWYGFIGLVPLITGMIGYCPAYAIFGISTARGKRPDE